jgi:hypothetical protein
MLEPTRIVIERQNNYRKSAPGRRLFKSRLFFVVASQFCVSRKKIRVGLGSRRASGIFELTCFAIVSKKKSRKSASGGTQDF